MEADKTRGNDIYLLVVVKTLSKKYLYFSTKMILNISCKRWTITFPCYSDVLYPEYLSSSKSDISLNVSYI